MRRRLHVLLPAAVLAGAAMTTGGIHSASAAVAANTYTIGVDNTSPSGHDWEYVDFFPRSNVNVTDNLDVVDFKWSTQAPNGFHTVTFLAKNQAPPPFALPDGDDGAGAVQQNGAAFAPAFGGGPPCGNTAGNPCVYTGNAEISSGAAPTVPPGNDFFVKFNAGVKSPTTISYRCLIHPGMVGSVSVVPTAALRSLPATVTAAAATQYAADTTAAYAKEGQVNSASVTTNSNGTHTISMTAGTATPNVEILEMLPNNVNAQVGDTVKWTTTTISDIHTVTFPNGHGSDSVDPFGRPVCEGGPPDTAAPAPQNPPAFGCANPGVAEAPLYPQPQGPAVISSPSTVATSGLIGNPQGGFPNSYSLSFSAPGSFVYQCRIHDAMVGTVFVSAAATQAPGGVVTAPNSGGARASTAGGVSGAAGWLLAGLVLLLGAAGGARMVARRSRVE